jgi:hypothetical protein
MSATTTRPARVDRRVVLHPERSRPPKTPHVIALPEPVHLFGRRGPFVIGVMSDAPGAVRALWLPANR